MVVINIKVRIPVWLDRICTWPVMVYRQWKFGYPYRRIRLTEGKFTIVDPGDFYRLNSFNWLCSGRDENLYAARPIRTKTGRLNTILMHKEILKAPPGLLVDHTNTNSLDNRRSNLRLVTRKENLSNRGPRSRTNLSECCRLERLFPFAVTVNYWRGKWVVKMHRVCISPEDVENLAKSIELR